MNTKLIFSLLLFSFISFNCFLLDNNKTVAEKKQEKIIIQGQAQIHTPYCGGAAPPPDIAKGSFSPIENSNFYLILKGDSTKTAIDSFNTDNKGHFEIELIPDEYSIFEANKMLPFDKFINKNTSNQQFTENKAEACFKNWYNTPDFELNAIKDTSINIVINSRCYVGINPCLIYNGPIRP